MATAEVDVARLSSFCALPQTSLESLLDTPTGDLVRTLLRNLSPRVHEYEGLKADKLKLHVELENAVRGGESKSRVLKNSIDKNLKENASLKLKLQGEEQARLAVESELETLKSSTANSTSEVTTLKTRISSLESSNRDTLSLLETKSSAYDKLAEELSNQHQKTVKLRQEVATLEQRAQLADATASTARYREQSLSQEIEQLKRNNDWLDRELKAKSQEYSSFRKEKNARLVELQRLNEEAANSSDGARRMEQTLRGRIDELSGKVEEYLSRIQQISEEATRAEESYKKRNDSNERLIELTRNSVATERLRLQELQEELESTKENAQNEISRLASEIETDGHARDVAEQRIAEMESQVERLEAEVIELRAQRREEVSFHNGVNGQPATPNRTDSLASVMFSPNRSRVKGGLSMTQLYSQNTELKAEIAGLRQENERLKASVDEMLQDAESARPEIEEARTENARLESEAAQMSALVGQISKERDQAVKNARKTSGDIEAKTMEGEVLRQQLRDLSMQIKILLFELDRREKGLDNFTTDQQMQLEQLSRNEAESGATDTDCFITAELVMYRKTAELQNQNTRLLRLTRELGTRMEREEAQRNEAEANKDTTDYKQLYGQCQDEIRSLLAQSQSYIRERDMFRRMLTHRGQLPPNDDGDSMFAKSINGLAAPATPSQSNMMNSIEESPHAKDMANYAKLLKEMQSHFDSYRTEASTDNKTLREQVDKLSSQNRELRGDNVKKESQVTLADERYQMLQSNYSMLKTENGELQKRSQFFSDNAAKQELRTQQAAEDLVEAKGLLDSMRNDNANLKAEKEFFKTIEKRLTADNEAHFTEKARLNTLNTSLQNLLNERDQAEADTRRKLQAQIDMLEHELQATKRTLSEQAEEYKRLTDRRDYDHHQSQKRIDDLLASLGTVREELAAAKASREHLQARVDELTTTLRSAEERLQLLQPAHSGQSNDSARGQSTQVNGNDNGNGEQTLPTKEQELAVELSELRRDLHLARNDLENAKGQVEQYKSISQSSEEELQSLNETQELYRQDMDKLLEERNVSIRQLEQRLSDIHNELTSTNSELTELRTKEAETDRKIQEQKSIFEAEIAQLKDQDDRHATAAKYHQEDLKAQAAIAQQAQQNYENELVKHAEAAKALQKVRGDFNELKVQVVELKTDADSARTNLAQSEESWVDTKARYESEIKDLNEGKKNLAGQNDRLHQQLETLGTQIANLQKRPASDDPDRPGVSGISSGLDNLQEVIKYLRREKEIVDVQLELSAQETKRLNQQLDYTQIQLDETRLKLNQQRRVEQDTERSALNHNKLVDTINELNTFRESNVTLRNESRQAQASLASKIREVEQLVARVEPLQAEVRNLRDQQENQAGELRLLQEDRDRWRQRTQDILQKYDRVDPAELEALKNELQDLKTERQQLLLSKQTLQEQVDGHEGQTKEKVEELRSRLTEQFKTRSKTLTGTIRERDASLQAVGKEKLELEQRLEHLQQDLEKASAEKDRAIENANAATANASNANAPSGSEDGQVDEDEPSKAERPEVQALQEKLEAAEAKASEEAVRSSSLQDNVSIATSRISELEAQIQELQQKLDTVSKESGQLQAQLSQNEASAASDAASKESLDKLQHELEQAQQDVNNLRAAASIQASSGDGPAVEGGKSVAEQLSEMREEMRNAIQTELEARHDERVRKAEETFERRTQAMKNQLSKKLAEGKEQVRQEKEEALQALRAAHMSELEDLKRRHQEELDELKRQDETRFADFKTSWAAEHKADEKGAEPSGRKEDNQITNTSWEPTEAEARNLVSSNVTIRGILNGNIARKVSEARNTLTAHLNEEHAKEMTTKVQAAQANAIHMEAMKYQLKFSAQEKKLRTCQAQIESVTKAADETPSRPVVEVWAIAKDAKPAAAPPSGPSSTIGTVRSGNVPQNPPMQQPAAASQQTQVSSQPGTFGQPTTLTPLQQTQAPSEPALAPPSNALQSSNVRGPQQSGLAQPASNLPVKQQVQGQVGNHPNAGAGQAALRGLQSSGLPIARGGPQSNRGSRGRGQMGRGGLQPVSTQPAQNANQAAPSPTSQLSGAARQFVPQGNKRPREDGEGMGQHGGDGGNGKRIRGGGGGGT
ncbi:MAG: hypothetical protein LQ352_001125 [Teloschistes flavicans]|nr:MAG: hypothetical protein LQ352_001125 [Teloschistes flavicans]